MGIPWHVFPTAFSSCPSALSLLGLNLSQNTGCLASTPNESQVLMSHYKNSVREKAMGKKWICYDSERKALFRVWAIAKGKGSSQGMWPG